MTLRQIRISAVPDAAQYDDGDYDEAISTDQPIAAGPPINSDHVLRLSDLLTKVYPIGSIYISVTSTNPGTLFGGTWTGFGAGKVLVGIDAGDTDFDTVEESGGDKTKAISGHSGSDVDNHDADVTGHEAEGAVGVLTGSDANVAPENHTHPTPVLSHNVTQPANHDDLDIIQPYIVVYMWKRTA